MIHDWRINWRINLIFTIEQTNKKLIKWDFDNWRKQSPRLSEPWKQSVNYYHNNPYQTICLRLTRCFQQFCWPCQDVRKILYSSHFYVGGFPLTGILNRKVAIFWREKIADCRFSSHSILSNHTLPRWFIKSSNILAKYSSLMLASLYSSCLFTLLVDPVSFNFFGRL